MAPLTRYVLANLICHVLCSLKCALQYELMFIISSALLIYAKVGFRLYIRILCNTKFSARQLQIFNIG
jgi:hypothetical protein